MEDYLGNELKVGDDVVYIESYSSKQFGRGIVKKIGTAKITVKFNNIASPGKEACTIRDPKQILKVYTR